ncbi:uncharacterized protein LOC121861365 [Homarus americanus]|uniref:Pol Pro-Pol polyprotein-like 2 n=1 Tax=Homarus americanus TaxID=6706 RepID=A0A8J5T6D2_HOMAM|nr:uncharacterized protein LOC121861365 [Homarus americanus]KAG7172785.1 pol Pro-Pol polyprotein-like 2 [Homarus americanus]
MVPTCDATSDIAARTLFDRWVCTFGVPQSLSSAWGPHFTSEMFRAVCRMTGIHQKLGMLYHPRSQAQMERQNQFMDNLQCLCDNNFNLWPEMVPHLQFSHNSSRNATTGYDQHELEYGVPARCPEQLVSEKTSRDDPNFRPADLSNAEVGGHLVREKLGRIAKALCLAKGRVAVAQGRRYKKYCNREGAFRVGNLVQLKLSPAERHKKGGKKMAPYQPHRYCVITVLRGGWSYQRP